MQKIYTNKPNLLEELSIPFETTCNVQDEDVVGCIIFGGDGTIIRSLKYLWGQRKHKLAMFGINTGHLGFLSCSIPLNDIIFIINSGLDERYRSPIYPLKIELIGPSGSIIDTRMVINDLVIQPQRRGHLFQTFLTLNGMSPITYEGDGLVIASTTGSTAYNISLNGPILTPDMKAVIVNPIAPFTMSARPIVISENYNIELMVKEEPYIAFDGQEYETEMVISSIRVSIMDNVFNLMRNGHFTDIIQKKLHWNKSIKEM